MMKEEEKNLYLLDDWIAMCPESLTDACGQHVHETS